MNRIEPWEVLRSRTIVERTWMRLRVDEVRLPDDTILDEYHVIDFPEWALVVCVDHGGNLVMTTQYRHGIGASSLELPAGMIDASEAPLAGARRELLEETGYEAAAWTSMGTLSPNPARQTNRVHLFVATGARRVSEQRLDVSEHIRVRPMTVEEVLDAAMDGGIVHASHVAALLMAERAGWLCRGEKAA